MKVSQQDMVSAGKAMLQIAATTVKDYIMASLRRSSEQGRVSSTVVLQIIAFMQWLCATQLISWMWIVAMRAASCIWRVMITVSLYISGWTSKQVSDVFFQLLMRVGMALLDRLMDWAPSVFNADTILELATTAFVTFQSRLRARSQNNSRHLN